VTATPGPSGSDRSDGKSVPRAGFARSVPLLREQEDPRQHLRAMLGAAPGAELLTVPVRWLRALLEPAASDLGNDQGLALAAAEAAQRVGLSSSRLKRLAAAGLAPGAYREAGAARGGWRFPMASLRALQDARRRGLHRGVGHQAAGVA
jgi:hypothetical protein